LVVALSLLRIKAKRSVPIAKDVTLGDLESKACIMMRGAPGEDCLVEIPFVFLRYFIPNTDREYSNHEREYLDPLRRMIHEDIPAIDKGNRKSWEDFNCHFIAAKLSLYSYIKEHFDRSYEVVPFDSFWQGAEFGENIRRLQPMLHIPDNSVSVVCLTNQFTGDLNKKYLTNDMKQTEIKDYVVYKNGDNAMYADLFFKAKVRTSDNKTFQTWLLTEQNKFRGDKKRVIKLNDELNKVAKMTKLPYLFTLSTTSIISAQQQEAQDCVLVQASNMYKYYGEFSHCF
jgi:hypothetical protein